MATIRLIPSTYSTGSTNVSVTNANNMYANTDSTNYATATTSRSGNTYVYIKGFNFNDVPSNAIIDSFSIKLKASMSGVSTSTNYRPVLCNNTTAISNGSGSSVITTSVQTITFTGVTQSWDTIKGYGSNFGIRVNARRSNNGTTSYLYIYGAEIEVNYRLPIYHNVTSTLSTDRVDSISPEGLTSVLEGDDYILTIEASSIDDVKVEDNGNDVTSQLVRHNTPSGTFTSSFTPSSYDSSSSSYYSGYNNTSDSAVDGVYNNNYPSNGVGSESSSNRACVFSNTGSSAQSRLVYTFDVSDIPLNATITSVTCAAKASAYSATTYFSSRVLQLYCGNTAKGSSANVTANGGTGSAYTFDGGSWTVAELQDINLRYTLTRSTSSPSSAASFSFWGATLTVGYTISPENPYYWTYTISNVVTAHSVVVADAIILPPDEDPTKTYYPITISSANATTDPSRGTKRVESGTSETIYIYPSDPLVTLVTDNGVDVSSQLVHHGSAIPDPTVATAQGASYGFTYSSSTGYYVSQNAGVSSSAAVCRVTFNLPVRCLVTIQYINYAEATYDYGVFGNIDVALGTTSAVTSDNAKLRCSTSEYNTSTPQTLTYEISSGSHFIDIKYRKDTNTNSNNDNLQWKILSIEPLEPNEYYTYSLPNINQEHSLIFVFGDVTYYFVNSTANGDCTLYPNGQMVELPGDAYSLTIVPNNSGDTVTITDNNIDVTAYLERKQETITKDGVQITVVNYIYRINNVQATHNISVSSYSPTQGSVGYIKRQGSWVQAVLNVKNNSTWKNVIHTYGKIQGEWDDSDTMSTPFIGIVNNT